jgi:hypothetical protein
VTNPDFPVKELPAPKSWPVNIVAVFFLLQGLSAGYSALASVGLFGYSGQPGITVGFATLDAIVSIALIVAGAGLLARNKACLTVAVILAGLYLMSGGSNAAAAFFGPTATPMTALVAIAFIAIGWLQYVILRSRSTMALFSGVSFDQYTGPPIGTLKSGESRTT